MKSLFLISIIITLMISSFSSALTINNNRISSGTSIVSSNLIKFSHPRQSSKLLNSEIDNDAPSTDEAGATKKSLENKMKEWEASEEEIKAASLGGITPGRADGFDIGLFLAFPFIVGSALLFAVFPFIMDKIDVSSVGPPPTV